MFGREIFREGAIIIIIIIIPQLASFIFYTVFTQIFIYRFNMYLIT